MEFTLIVLAAAIIWLVVLGIRDLRRKAYVWGVVRLLVAAGIILLPIPTHSVTTDLPSA
ncbi:MAG: hypothetical protein AAF559_08280 [Pseudomonadota bacterium]